MGILVNVDNGGTFTDMVITAPAGWAMPFTMKKPLLESRVESHS